MEPHYFNLSTLPLYCVGFLTFLCTLIDDWLNPKRKLKKFLYYVQEFIYTVISIALGISLCFSFETSQSISWVVSIIMGLCGSSIIRTIRNKREDIGDSVVEKIKDTIRNPGSIKSGKTNRDVLESEISGDKPYESYDDVCAESGYMGDDEDYPNDTDTVAQEPEESAEERMRKKFASINKNK